MESILSGVAMKIWKTNIFVFNTIQISIAIIWKLIMLSVVENAVQTGPLYRSFGDDLLEAMNSKNV